MTYDRPSGRSLFLQLLQLRLHRRVVRMHLRGDLQELDRDRASLRFPREEVRDLEQVSGRGVALRIELQRLGEERPGALAVLVQQRDDAEEAVQSGRARIGLVAVARED